MGAARRAPSVFQARILGKLPFARNMTASQPTWGVRETQRTTDSDCGMVGSRAPRPLRNGRHAQRAAVAA